MPPIDQGILLLYLLLVVGTGFLLTHRASKSMNSYFLGGRSLPWWLLGVSNAASMFEISRAMWMVYMLFVCGLKGVWIP